MKYIKQLLFGVRCEPHPPVKDGYHTTMPSKCISFNDWCLELKVSSRVPRHYEKIRLY
jgi:hypothetical protein